MQSSVTIKGISSINASHLKKPFGPNKYKNHKYYINFSYLQVVDIWTK